MESEVKNLEVNTKNKKITMLAPTSVLLFLYGVCSIGYGLYVPVMAYKEFAGYFPMYVPLLPLAFLATAALLIGGYLLIISAVSFFNKKDMRRGRNKSLVGLFLVLIPWWIAMKEIVAYDYYKKKGYLMSDLIIIIFILINLFLFWQLYRISKKLPIKT